MDAVRQHLIKTIPGLTDISKTAVSYLFCPPTKSWKSSERYKGYIQARVPAKRNNMQKKNIDSHYLFSRVKKRREFSQKISDEVIALSCDDMNKLNVGGGMMVSRYHQIRRIYMKDVSPYYEDCDFNLPGYKIIPSEYMLLEFNNNLPMEYQQSSDKCYHDAHFNIDDTDGNFYRVFRYYVTRRCCINFK